MPLAVPGPGMPNTCDLSPNGGLMFCPGAVPPPNGPPGAVEISCGDALVPAVGTVQFYVAGYNAVAVGAPAFGCGVIAPPLPAASAVFTPPAGVGNPFPDCYRIDDDASVGAIGTGLCTAGAVGAPCSNPGAVGCGVGGVCDAVVGQYRPFIPSAVGCP